MLWAVLLSPGYMVPIHSKHDHFPFLPFSVLLACSLWTTDMLFKACSSSCHHGDWTLVSVLRVLFNKAVYTECFSSLSGPCSVHGGFNEVSLFASLRLPEGISPPSPVAEEHSLIKLYVNQLDHGARSVCQYPWITNHRSSSPARRLVSLLEH